jgi:predicted secreted protein
MKLFSTVFLSGAALALGGALQPVPAAAQGLVPAPMNVVSLSASASVEVPKDWLTVAFSTSREGPDAATVQGQLRQALDSALTEARKSAKPGQLEVQTGAFSLYPRYAPPGTKGLPAGGINGWQGNAELLVEGRDTQAIAQLTGRIQSMVIARVGFSLSREAREKVEADVAAQAIARFRARADAVTKQFGMASHTVREVAVQSSEPQGGMVTNMLRAKSSAAMSDESLPVEAGKAVVTATVSGSVQMNK